MTRIEADAETRRRVNMLTDDLTAMLGRDSPESQIMARRVIHRGLELRAYYGANMPGLLHNGAVGIGVRPRGKCCHWARDLLDHLKEVKWADFDLYWGVANFGTPFEHSCIVATPHGEPFDRGMVFDAWRHSGFVYWTRVGNDGWEWEPHPLAGPDVHIACSD